MWQIYICFLKCILFDILCIVCKVDLVITLMYAEVGKPSSILNLYKKINPAGLQISSVFAYKSEIIIEKGNSL